MGRSTISVKLLLILTVGGVCLTGCGQATSTSTAKAADSTTNNSTTTAPTTTAIPAPATETPATTPPTAATTPAAAPTTEAPPATTPPTAAPAPPKALQAGPEYFFDSYGSRYAAFKSPSGRIACDIRDDTASCIIFDNNWDVPPPDEYCDASWGGSVEVGNDSARLTCVGGMLSEGPTLPYGYEIEFGPILCHSEETGVTCDNQETGHGFKVNRASFDLY